MSSQSLMIVSALLFALGVFGVLWNRGAVMILMCIEIMLNASNLLFIVFSRQYDHPRRPDFCVFHHDVGGCGSGGRPGYRDCAVPTERLDGCRRFELVEVVERRC